LLLVLENYGTNIGAKGNEFNLLLSYRPGFKGYFITRLVQGCALKESNKIFQSEY